MVKKIILIFIFTLLTGPAFFRANAFMPTMAFWSQGPAPVIQIDMTGTGLGPSPSNDPSMRTVTMGGTNIVSYKAVVLSSGACTDLGVAGALDAATIFSVATPYSFTPTDNANNKICAVGRNSSGVWQKSTAPSGATLVIDTVSPLFTAANFTINSGVSPTTNNYISNALQSTDDRSGVAKICFKSNNSTAPLAADSCWAPVPVLGGTVGTTVNLTNASFILGFSAGFYTVYAWAQDLAGNISALTNTGAGTSGRDKQTIQYDPPQPPVLLNITATNNDTATPTPANTDINFASGQAVVIKWKVTSVNPLPANPISLSYTTDESNFNGIVSGIANSASAGCTVDGTNFTGCYVWSVPGAPAGYFKVRVTVLDTLGLGTINSSPGVNTGQFQVIAGNTELGLGGSARTAMFQPWPAGGEGIGSPHTFVINSKGVLYFNDYYRGILKVDPINGLQTLMIPKTWGAFTGEGGPATSATLVDPLQIVLDSQDRLLIHDGDRILRVENNGNIQTIIGGGANNADGTLGTNFQIQAIDGFNTRAYGTLIPAPNGDLYFTEGDPYFKPVDGFKLRWYKAADQKVYSISFTGVGDYDDPNIDFSNFYFTNIGIQFDPITKLKTKLIARATEEIPGDLITHNITFDVNTGVSVGAGTHVTPAFQSPWGSEQYYYSPFGDLYFYNPQYSIVSKYNPGTNTWTKILGNDMGQCPDGTAALSCPIQLDDLFVDANNQIYFLDGGAVRTIVNGNVVTLFGQQLSTGVGASPLAARFPNIDFHDQSQSNKIVINDHLGGYLWEFGRTGNLTKLAGNGVIDYPMDGATAATSTFTGRQWNDGSGIVVDPATNDIYASGYHNDGWWSYSILKLNRLSGIWETVLDPGGVDYWLADGRSDAVAPYINWSLMGTDGTNILASIWHWTGSTQDQSYMKLYDKSTGVQSHFAGAATLSPDCFFDGDGSPVSTSANHPCYYSHLRSTWDGANNRWLFGERWGTRIVEVPYSGGVAGNVNDVVSTVNSTVSSFAYRVEGGKDIYYYCGFTDGRIYKVDTVAGTEVALTWPSPTFSCTGRSMTINTALNVLEFPFNQNGLFGMAQYYIGPP